MISCRRARALLVENVREAAGEVMLLQLDQHLAGCADCRRERARWETIGSLREWQPPTLSNAARDRVARALRQAQPKPRAVTRSFLGPSLVLAGAALALTAYIVWPKPERNFADVSYRPGAIASLEPATRTIRIDKGEVEVTGRELSVRTPTYLVHLTQAHAVFGADAIRVVSGEVFVFTLDGKQLATLSAGQGWPPKTPAPVAAPAPIAPVAAPAPIAPVAAPAPKMSATTALDRARSALADGDAVAARRFIQKALAASPSTHDRAEAELFTAESYLVEKDAARAVAQYRRVAQSFPRLPEGETAAFAAAQVLSESGPRDDSREAFGDYLRRYPDGRFAREARDRLKE
jgi:TolA-binding protein